MPGLMLIYIN